MSTSLTTPYSLFLLQSNPSFSLGNFCLKNKNSAFVPLTNNVHIQIVT